MTAECRPIQKIEWGFALSKECDIRRCGLFDFGSSLILGLIWAWFGSIRASFCRYRKNSIFEVLSQTALLQSFRAARVVSADIIEIYLTTAQLFFRHGSFQGFRCWICLISYKQNWIFSNSNVLSSMKSKWKTWVGSFGFGFAREKNLPRVAWI